MSFLSIIPADAVVRNVYYKYFHPKEALVSNGVLNRFVGAALLTDHNLVCVLLFLPTFFYSFLPYLFKEKTGFEIETSVY